MVLYFVCLGTARPKTAFCTHIIVKSWIYKCIFLIYAHEKKLKYILWNSNCFLPSYYYRYMFSKEIINLSPPSLISLYQINILFTSFCIWLQKLIDFIFFCSQMHYLRYIHTTFHIFKITHFLFLVSFL